MLTIPFKAKRMGAESINQNPIKYNKTRISGSQKVSYILHIKGAYMPGQKEIFSASAITKPKLNDDIFNNQTMSAFQLEKNIFQNYENTKKEEFVPNDDDALAIAIRASYRHVFGNILLMDADKPINVERRLRNGDITIRGFIRQICKSEVYRYQFFDKMNQYRSIKLRHKHILGRPIKDQKEFIESCNLLNDLGFENHIDWLIDSKEYNQAFGEDIVPYMRSWNSDKGFKTNSFLKTSELTKSFTHSDICKTI